MTGGHLCVFLHHPMNSLTSLPYLFLNSRYTPPHLSFSTPRRSRRRRPTRHRITTTTTTTTSSSVENVNINLVLDFNQISLVSSSKSRLHQFVSATRDAYTDLTTIVSVDDDGRLFLSCRKSTVQFVGGLFVAGLLLDFVIRVFVKLGLGFRSRFGVGKQSVVVRRDRSLGGKEVVVGTRDNNFYTNTSTVKALDNPLSLAISSRAPRPALNSFRVVRSVNKLPKWWSVPDARENRTLVVDKEEYQREANRLIRAIINWRTSGQDIMDDDIIQLRRICRTSGVRVSIETINTRDSLYRTAVDYVLNFCSRAPCHSTPVLIDGEDARHFVAGLADNIGLENIRAARMVSAAVAAHTRSRFLQAWALEMQGNHSGALLELSKICHVLRIFPPVESSPEMEMVARGLEKLLKVEQRQFLMNMLVGVCSEENHRSAAEALGLVFSFEGNGDQHETSILEN